MDPTEANGAVAGPPTRLAARVALACCLLAFATAGLPLPWIELYGDMGLELPWVTTVVFRASDALREGWGVLVSLAVLGLFLSPLRVVPGSTALRSWLGLGLWQAALLGLVLWGALELPLVTLRNCLCDGPCWGFESNARSKVVLLGLGAASFASLGVGLAQAGAWSRLSIDAVGLPRAAPRVEVARVALIGALPALVLAVVVHAVVDEWRLRPPAWLLVRPALAAAGTAVLVTFGAALAIRLRRPDRPHLDRRQE